MNRSCAPARTPLLGLLLATLLACGGSGGSDPLPTDADIQLHGWYITQATQRLDRGVPLVAERDGVLRVFLRAATANAARPLVRATLLDGGAPWSATVQATAGGVPTRCDELDAAGSWNLRIPGEALRPGARLRLEVDPDRRVPGVAESDRVLEAPLDVREVAPMRITLVPVVQAGSGLAGVAEGPGRTRESWGEMFRKVFPVARVELEVGPPLVTAAVLDGHGARGAHDDHDDPAWTRLLGELEQRMDEDCGAGRTGRYYYGVVRRSNGNGTLGMTPVQSPVAAGWDAPAAYQTTFAHEMGHALGLGHAPFNLPADEPTPGWPEDPAYAQASLGAVGMDPATLAVKPPRQFKDIMSYAPAGRLWVSDHNYLNVFNLRAQRHGPRLQPPMIEAILPTQGRAGTVITVTGRLLATTRRVEFVAMGMPPVPAEFERVDSTRLRVTVPAPAPSGQLRVSTQWGFRVSDDFFVGNR